MKRINFWMLLVSGALTLPASLVFSQEEAKKPDAAQTEELFKKLDKNGDGKLVPDEISEDQGRFFDRLVRLGDKDDNGELTRAEFDAALQRSDAPVQGGGLDRGPGGPGGRPMFEPKQILERMDKNKDGKLTKDEIPEEGPARFLRDMLERVGKDSLTLEDLERARERMAAMAGPGGAGGAPGEFLKRLDRNGDGKLQKDELPEPLRDRFARLFERAGKDELSLDEARRAFAEFGPPNGPPGAGPGFRGNPEEMFKRMDSNNDGKVALSEIPEPLRERMKPMFERAKKDELSLDDVKGLLAQAPEGGPRRDGERRPEGDRPRDGERRPDAERPREGDRPRDGERRPEGDRPRDGERRPEGDRPRDGERRPEGDRPRDGERRPDAERPREGDRPREGERRPGVDGPRPQPRLFQVLDRNKDGRISREELAELREAFGELDTNRDGQLDMAELIGPPPPEGGRPPVGDRGPDGRPRPDAGRPGEQPREGDRRPDAERPREGERRPGADRPREAPPAGNRGQQLRELDKNGDGKISKDEAPERLRGRFEQLDRNKDGQLDREEIQEAFQERRREQ